MRKRGMLVAAAVAAVSLGVATYALADGPGFNHLSETLIGYQEVPSISTTGTATFTADVANDGESISYQLSYSGLEGNILQSHIHFGQRSVNGAIVVFLCTNLGNGPVGTQTCPASPHTITGVIDRDDVLCGGCAPAPGNPFGQGIGAGEWEEFLRAVEAGKTYVNIHTNRWPGGEIRAQINETGTPRD